MFNLRPLNLNNFLHSGIIFSDDEANLQAKYILSNILLSVLFLILVLLTLLHVWLGNYFYVKINLVAMFVSLSTILLLRKISKKSFYTIAHVAFVLFYIILFVAFYGKSETFPIAAWFIVYIMATFFIFDEKTIFIYIALFLILFTIITLLHIHAPLNLYIGNFIAPSIIGYVFIYAYEKRSFSILTKLKTINHNLEARVKLETKKRTKILENEKQHLNYLAYHDYLTRLPNMAMMDISLDKLVQISKDKKRHFALLYIDLDGFKKINDNFGHKFGNDILKIIANRLSENTHPDNLLARIGGDEFLVLIDNYSSKASLQTVIETYIREVKKEIIHQTIRISISCSIGISLYPANTFNKSELIIYADKSMLEAKKSKDINYKFYTQDINDLGYDNTLIKSEIPLALQHKQFIMHYQPQIDSNTNQIVGIEALVRWKHPVLGLIHPKYFLSIAKNEGLILDLEDLIIKESMRTSAIYHNHSSFQGRVSINISIQKLEDKNFITQVKELLEKTQCKAEWIEFEITETEIISNIEHMINIVQQLKTMNITIAIDDFGTGYSALSYLCQLNIDKIKIDKIFVDNLFSQKKHISIIDAIVAIAHSFNYTIVTEGVEEKKQVEYLNQHHCNIIQGYYYHKPMSSDKMMKLLQSQSSQGQE